MNFGIFGVKILKDKNIVYISVNVEKIIFNIEWIIVDII